MIQWEIFNMQGKADSRPLGQHSLPHIKKKKTEAKTVGNNSAPLNFECHVFVVYHVSE